MVAKAAEQRANLTCNLCGGRQWLDMNGRHQIRCADCNSLERTRTIKLHLDALGRPQPGDRVLHFAPELGLYRYFKTVAGLRYEVVDLDPRVYKWASDVKPFDIVRQIADLPDDSYDLILHSHVMEHVRCNLAAAFHHIHRALKPTGLHVFCLPFMRGRSGSEFGPMSAEEAQRRFGQADHVRRFGRDDVEATLGMLFPLGDYDLDARFGKETVDRINVPPSERRGYTGSRVFAYGKHEFLLNASAAGNARNA